MQDIFALPIEELQELFAVAGLKKFRAKQVFQWLYQKSVFDFAAMHNLSKADIVKAGVGLGVDYSLTVSCYQADDNGAACGKCDSCRLRAEGFAAAGVDDPTPYF